MKKSTTRITMAVSLLAASFCSHSTSIWEVKKGEDTVYLGGTVHLLPVSEFPLPKGFTDVYAQTDSIVLETALPDPTDANKRMETLKAMSYEEGITINDFVTENTSNQLTAYFDEVGVDFKTLNKFKPGFLAGVIVSIEANKAGMAGQGVDAYFSQLATRDNKPIEYLESFSMQLDMISKLGVGDEEAALSNQINEAKNVIPTLKSLIKAWRSGNEKQIDELAVKPLKKRYPASHDVLLGSRNKQWIPKIEAMFGDDDKEFVLVGTAHLVGEDSVVRLLKDKGYEVTKL